ncbi:hypothetical protein [Marisediminicola sp. LYQ134]|uniref:hypothetical protein n=1 Tax=unclassified Marisediminicola TaxID=2618316 RepID=UPI0039837A7B
MTDYRPPNPFDGRPGFWNRINRFLYPIAGPAQLGGGDEADVVPPDGRSLCPVCGNPMGDHDVRRGSATIPTRLLCPAPRETP